MWGFREGILRRDFEKRTSAGVYRRPLETKAGEKRSAPATGSRGCEVPGNPDAKRASGAGPKTR